VHIMRLFLVDRT